MAITSSTMPALGMAAPVFSLPEVTTGRLITLGRFTSRKALLVMFICRHCPYVKHVQHELARLGEDYADKDIGIVAISANDTASYPDDAPDSLKQMVQELCFTFPFCYDRSQEVAKAYTAVCTPDFFLFNKQRKLVYRGQLDGSRPGNSVRVTGGDLRAAIDAVLNDKPVSPYQKPSLGCNIKWKPGNEPEYTIK